MDYVNETKIFEVRDRATFLVVMATKLKSLDIEQKYLLGRIGWEWEISPIYVTMLHNGVTKSDRFAWDNRTMNAAHFYIQDNFDTLPNGAVIDVEYILGDTMEPKQSERML